MRRPTLRDIAIRAGVSTSTVSYALNEHSTLPLAEATKAKVRRIARELGYVPNGVARSLQSQSSRSVGMLLNKPLTTPRYAAIAQGLGEGLDELGMHVVLLDGAPVERCVDEVRSGRLDGLVFIGHDDHRVPDELAAAVARLEIPFVALDCGREASEPTYSTVDFDYERSVELVLGHLLGAGARTLYFVRPDLVSHAERSRESALMAVLGRHPEVTLRLVHTGVTAALLERIDATPAAASAYPTELRARLESALDGGDGDRGARVAVLCAWGADLELAYRVTKQRVPDALVGALAAGVLDPSLWPDLAHARLPLVEAGRACARLIAEATRGGDPEHLVLEPRLDTG